MVRAQHKTELRHTLCCVGACHSGMHAHIITYLPARPCGSACRPNHAPVYYRRGHIDQAKKIVAEIGRELGRTRYAGRSACRKEVLRGPSGHASGRPCGLKKGRREKGVGERVECRGAGGSYTFLLRHQRTNFNVNRSFVGYSVFAQKESQSVFQPGFILTIFWSLQVW